MRMCDDKIASLRRPGQLSVFGTHRGTGANGTVLVSCDR